MVKNDMNQEDLIQSFKAITDNIKKTGTKRSGGLKSGAKAGSSNNTDAVPPTKSSKPTGSKWTMDALSKNIMAALNISPASSAAIKDILGLPIKHQLTLLNAISERYHTKKRTSFLTFF